MKDDGKKVEQTQRLIKETDKIQKNQRELLKCAHGQNWKDAQWQQQAKPASIVDD